jgi:hypothetical protein
MGATVFKLQEPGFLDSTTKKPVENVKVYKKSRTEQNTLTNVEGSLELRSISGGLSGCPLMTVVLTKAGYQTHTTDVSSNASTIICLNRDQMK